MTASQQLSAAVDYEDRKLNDRDTAAQCRSARLVLIPIILESFGEVEDSLAVGQQWKGDERVILFLKMNSGFDHSEELKQSIKSAIRAACSPRHVPAIILPIADIPYTINGKKVEIAVKKIIHGDEALNRDALANPEALELYKELSALRS